MKYLRQILGYAVFAATIGLLSVWPRYKLLGADEAVISLTISHAAERVGECRRLTQEELNELPPNMRKPMDCPRERHPIRVQLRADGRNLYTESAPPSGLWSDGKAVIYKRIRLEAGRYELFVGMNDSGGREGFDFEVRESRYLSPGQNLVIDFDESRREFVFR